MLNILWASKTGDANSWYHIKPFRECDLVDEIYVVRYRKPKRFINDIKYYTFPVSNRIIEIINFIYHIIRVLIIKKIDLVVSFNPYPWGLISFFLAKVMRKPILLGLIGGELDFERTNRFKRTVLLNVLKYVDLITVTGEGSKEELSLLGINKSKIHVFPHLVDIDYLKNFNKKNIESNIITITSFLPVKRTEDAIKALALTKDKGLNLKMVILGDGPDKGSLMELAIKLGLENSIVFEGFVEDIRPYINNSEYYLQTSSSEGLSIALIESMASGLIPIVTNVGDEKEVVKDYETGFFVPVGAPKEIANKLLLLDSNPLKKKIKNNIKQKMKRSSISYSNQYISSLLKSLM